MPREELIPAGSFLEKGLEAALSTLVHLPGMTW
jgi:hypothetical protein